MNITATVRHKRSGSLLASPDFRSFLFSKSVSSVASRLPVLFFGHSHFSNTLDAWPSGSRISSPRLNPAWSSAKSTTPGETNVNFPVRRRPSASRISVVMKLVCQ